MMSRQYYMVSDAALNTIYLFIYSISSIFMVLMLNGSTPVCLLAGLMIDVGMVKRNLSIT